MNCNFTTEEKEGLYTHTCTKCGAVRTTSSSSLVRKCDFVEPEALSQDPLSLAGRFLNERQAWIQAGKPYRTPERIAEIFDNQCTPCENFNQEGEGKGACGICGCRLLREGKFLNKIAWATTKCPLSPPKWDAEELPSPPKKTGLFSPASESKPSQIEGPPPANQTIEKPRQGGCGCGR